MYSYSNKNKKQKVSVEKGTSNKKTMYRIYIVTVCLCFAFMIVLARASYLHLVNDDQLRSIAKQQYNAKIPVSVRRGKIFDRNGEELAVSLPVPSVYVDPTMVRDVAGTVKALSPILEMSEKELLEKIAGGKRFAWLKRRISYDTMKKVAELKLPGVSSIEESRRFYPNGELASQVLGAVGHDSQALSGIELLYNDVLSSKKRSVTYKRDAHGRLYAAPVGYEEQSDVGNIYLSIDKQIQFIADSALKRAAEEFQARAGIALVMDVNTGELLAMSNSAEFDPNRYSKYPMPSWRNINVTDTFEPGSTFKVLIVASAIDLGKVKPDTKVFCENGAIKIQSAVLKDHAPYGDLPVEDVIKFSSNIGALKVANKMEKQDLYEKLKSFGVGVETEIEYPGEVNGILRNYKSWQPVELGTIAFGQGVSVTPLQMVTAYSSVVNGGMHYKPRLVERIVDRDGVVRSGETPIVLGSPINAQTSEIMRKMMARVVEKGGTGTKAASESYSIGGKTGTAQKAIEGGNGYAKGKYFASFIGFAPVDAPRIVVMVGLDEPKGSYYGGAVSAPAVKEIVERTLRYLDVPSRESPVLYTAEAEKKSEVPATTVEVKDVAEVKTTETKPAEEVKSPEKFVKAGGESYVMPDMTGLTMREVLSASGTAKINAEVTGSGIAVNQVPAPGAVIKEGERFSVRFAPPK